MSIASNFCCDETELRKLHTPLTYMVLFLGFNLAETTLAQPPQSRGQAQQKPNSAKAPLPQWKLNEKKPSAVEVTRSPPYWKPGQQKQIHQKAHTVQSLIPGACICYSLSNAVTDCKEAKGLDCLAVRQFLRES